MVAHLKCCIAAETVLPKNFFEKSKSFSNYCCWCKNAAVQNPVQTTFGMPELSFFVVQPNLKMRFATNITTNMVCLQMYDRNISIYFYFSLYMQYLYYHVSSFIRLLKKKKENIKVSNLNVTQWISHRNVKCALKTINWKQKKKYWKYK